MFKGEEDDVLKKYDVTFEDKLLLIETGLLQPENSISRGLPLSENDYVTYFQCGKYIIKASKKANTPDSRFEILRFTKIGEELLKLLTQDPTEDYIKEFTLRLEKLGLDVEYAFILAQTSQDIQHSRPWLRFPKDVK